MMLNGKMFNPAEMRTRIQLQERSIGSDAAGSQRPVYSTVAEVWAKWTNVHGNEVWQSKAAQAVQPATVLIRYRADIDNTWRVLKGGQAFEVVSLDDIQDRHQYIELKVQSVRGA